MSIRVPFTVGMVIDLNGKYFVIKSAEGEGIYKLSKTVDANKEEKYSLVDDVAEEGAIYEFTRIGINGKGQVRIEYPRGAPKLATKEATYLTQFEAPVYAPLQLKDMVVEPNDAPNIVIKNPYSSSISVDVYLWFNKYYVEKITKDEFDKAPAWMKARVYSKR